MKKNVLFLLTVGTMCLHNQVYAQSQLHKGATTMVPYEIYFFDGNDTVAKIVYDFDVKGEWTYQLIQSYHDGQWVDSLRTNKKFHHVTGERIMQTIEKWNGTVWDTLSKSGIGAIYNEQGLIIQMGTTTYSYTFNDHQQILTILKCENGQKSTLTTNTYDAQYNLTEYLYMGYDGGETPIKPLAKEYYTYYANNLLDSTITYRVDNDEFILSKAIVNSYDQDGNRTQLLNLSRKNSSDTVWHASSRYNYSFDENKNLLLAERYNYRDTGWALIIRESYEYDNNNNRINEIIQEYAANLNALINKQKKERAYDSLNNLLTYTEFTYASEKWWPSSQYAYVYDTNNNSVEGYSKKWNMTLSDWLPQLTNSWSLYYNQADELKVSSLKQTSNRYYAVYRELGEVSVKYQTMESNVVLYPNPANNKICLSNVENSKIFIYNIIGEQILYTYSSSQIAEIDVSALPTGIYIVQIEKDRKISIRKMQVIK